MNQLQPGKYYVLSVLSCVAYDVPGEVEQKRRTRHPNLASTLAGIKLQPPSHVNRLQVNIVAHEPRIEYKNPTCNHMNVTELVYLEKCD